MALKNNNNIISQKELPEDKKMDLNLRPKILEEFIGQEKLKANLRIFIHAAQQRRQPLEHALFHGNHGLGKRPSHISLHVKWTRKFSYFWPALERVGDLAAILTSLKDKSILFIDEIHRLNRSIEEILYPAMEEYALDLIVGQGPSAKILRLDLPHFTLIGATTRPSLISPPLRDRFGAVYQLNFYQPSEIKEIILRSAKILKIKIEEKAAQEIAQCSRFTPRVANRLLKRVRDFAQVKGIEKINQKTSQQALEMLEIDKLGLNHTDRRILSCLIEKFSGGPIGIKTLAVAIGEDLNTIEEIYEPYLIQSGFLDRTLRGRIATPLAYKHLGFKNTLL